MSEPKFRTGDVVTWDDGKRAGVVTETAADGGVMVNGWDYGYFEDDELTLLHRPTPEPVRDPVREAGYPWEARHGYHNLVLSPHNAGTGVRVHIANITQGEADRIVALSKLPGVLREINERARNGLYVGPDMDAHYVETTTRAALESVGVKL